MAADHAGKSNHRGQIGPVPKCDLTQGHIAMGLNPTGGQLMCWISGNGDRHSWSPPENVKRFDLQDFPYADIA